MAVEILKATFEIDRQLIWKLEPLQGFPVDKECKDMRLVGLDFVKLKFDNGNYLLFYFTGVGGFRVYLGRLPLKEGLDTFKRAIELWEKK